MLPPVDHGVVEILSFGDGEFMYRVLTAAAMLRGDRAQSMTWLFLIGVMVGLISAAFRMLITGGKEFPIHHVLVSGILGMALIVPTTRVVVRSVTPQAYTASGMYSQPVDHVPLLAAWSGKFVTIIGYGLTKKMEQAFSTTSSSTLATAGGSGDDLATSGFSAKLELMAASGRLALMSQSSAGSPGLSASVKSFMAYYHDCTLRGLNSGEISEKMVLSNPRVMEGIKFNNRYATTQTYFGQNGTSDILSNPEYVDCVEGWDRLNKVFQSTQSVATVMDGPMRSMTKGIMNGSPVDLAARTFSEMGSTVGLDLGNYMAGLVLLATSRAAIAAGPNSLGESKAFAIATETAAEQRAQQAMGEENLYLRLMRPMIAFFEALMIGLFPFMVFLLGSGPAGTKIMIKYALLTVWVNLWFPVLAIINLYEQTQLEHAIQMINLQDATTNSVTSVMGILNMHDKIVDILTSTSTLAASTPALTMMLITGGAAVAASAMQGRLQGGDHMNEALPAPTPMKDMTVFAPQAMLGWDSANGTYRSGEPSTLVNHNFSEAYQQAAKSSFQDGESKSLQAQRNYSAAYQAMNAEGINLSDGLEAGIGHSNSTQRGALLSAAQQAGINFSEGYSFDHALADSFGMNAKAGVGAPEGISPVLMGVGGSGASSESSSANHNRKTAMDLQKLIQSNKTLQAAAGQVFSSAAKYAMSNNVAWQESATKQNGVAETVSVNEQATKAYEQAQSFSAGIGLSQSYNDLSLIQAFKHRDADGSRYGNLMDMARSSADREAAFNANFREISQRGLGADDRDRSILAAYYTLEGIGASQRYLDAADTNGRQNDLAVAADYVTDLKDAALQGAMTNAQQNAGIGAAASSLDADKTKADIHTERQHGYHVDESKSSAIEAQRKAMTEHSLNDPTLEVTGQAAAQTNEFLNSEHQSLNQVGAAPFIETRESNVAYNSKLALKGGAEFGATKVLMGTEYMPDPDKPQDWKAEQ